MDMVNSELINNIRENTKMSFNKKIFDFFMNEYLKQDMNAYSSKDGEALFDLIRINGENASNMNPKEYQELLLRLINKSIEYVNANGIKTNTQELTAKLFSLRECGKCLLILIHLLFLFLEEDTDESL
jgi:hypothetical protein